MSNIEIYLFVVLGVIVAVIFPVLRNLMAKYWPKTQGAKLPDWVKKYGLLFLFSAVSGLLVMAALASQKQIPDKWWVAFLAGFGWESTVEKIGTAALPTRK